MGKKYGAQYRCDSCPATALILFDVGRVGRQPTDADFPDTVVCGVRGCEGTKRRVIVGGQEKVNTKE